jgi:hypothetical protein
VLQAETWSLSGGVHHWLKRRSTREKRKPMTRNDDDNNTKWNFGCVLKWTYCITMSNSICCKEGWDDKLITKLN